MVMVAQGKARQCKASCLLSRTSQIFPSGMRNANLTLSLLNRKRNMNDGARTVAVFCEERAEPHWIATSALRRAAYLVYPERGALMSRVLCYW